MALREYICNDCGLETTELINGDYPKEIPCPECVATGYDGVAAYQISLPAKTSLSWGDNTGRFGVNGFYDRGLGATYTNAQQRDAICKQKGLVPLSEFGEGRATAITERNRDENAEVERTTKRYQAALAKNGGDQVRAIQEALPAHEMLAKADKV